MAEESETVNVGTEEVNEEIVEEIVDDEEVEQSDDAAAEEEAAAAAEEEAAAAASAEEEASRVQAEEEAAAAAAAEEEAARVQAGQEAAAAAAAEEAARVQAEQEAAAAAAEEAARVQAEQEATAAAEEAAAAAAEESVEQEEQSVEQAEQPEESSGLTDDLKQRIAELDYLRECCGNCDWMDWTGRGKGRRNFLTAWENKNVSVDSNVNYEDTLNQLERFPELIKLWVVERKKISDSNHFKNIESYTLEKPLFNERSLTEKVEVVEKLITLLTKCPNKEISITRVKEFIDNLY